VYKKILVTGGSGMVGQSLKEIIPYAKYLSSKDCNLTNYNEVKDFWEMYKPNIVIHLAAKVGGIMDNINHPAEYFEDNILMNTNVLMASKHIGVDRLIGILSTCIYPDIVDIYPMSEDMLHIGPPTKTNFSYGYAKRCLAVHIDSYNQQYGTKYQYLIPCNLYGEYDKYGDNSHFVAALIKKIFIAKKNGENEINLFGTGNPLRQFMHSSDLAYIIKYCIENDVYDNFNVATEENLSIKEIAEIVVNIIGDGQITKINFDPKKPDGQFRKDVSISKLKKIIPTFTPTKLSEGIKKTISNINFTS
jgi:GDP-L-fucose synthase